MTRAAAMSEAERIARDRAVAAGATSSSVILVDLEDLPVAYLPGDALRVRARVVGDIATGSPASASPETPPEAPIGGKMGLPP